MRKFLNTLFVLSEDSYLTLDGEMVVVLAGEEKRGQFPLHTLEEYPVLFLHGGQPRPHGQVRPGGSTCVF